GNRSIVESEEAFNILKRRILGSEWNHRTVGNVLDAESKLSALVTAPYIDPAVGCLNHIGHISTGSKCQDILENKALRIRYAVGSVIDGISLLRSKACFPVHERTVKQGIDLTNIIQHDGGSVDGCADLDKLATCHWVSYLRE